MPTMILLLHPSPKQLQVTTNSFDTYKYKIIRFCNWNDQLWHVSATTRSIQPLEIKSTSLEIRFSPGADTDSDVNTNITISTSLKATTKAVQHRHRDCYSVTPWLTPPEATPVAPKATAQTATASRQQHHIDSGMNGDIHSGYASGIASSIARSSCTYSQRNKIITVANINSFGGNYSKLRMYRAVNAMQAPISPSMTIKLWMHREDTNWRGHRNWSSIFVLTSLQAVTKAAQQQVYLITIYIPLQDYDSQYLNRQCQRKCK